MYEQNIIYLCFTYHVKIFIEIGLQAKKFPLRWSGPLRARPHASCFGKNLRLVRFIGCVFLTIHLRTLNFPGDVRHQLLNLTSVQIIKSSLLSVCLDVEVAIYSTKPAIKYGVSK